MFQWLGMLKKKKISSCLETYLLKEWDENKPQKNFS